MARTAQQEMSRYWKDRNTKRRNLGRSMKRRIGDRVKILGGMDAFVGQTGMIIENTEKDGPTTMYRVRLDTPVEIDGIGPVADDIWAGDLMETITHGIIRKGLKHMGGVWWQCMTCHASIRAECECCEPPSCVACAGLPEEPDADDDIEGDNDLEYAAASAQAPWLPDAEDDEPMRCRSCGRYPCAESCGADERS